MKYFDTLYQVQPSVTELDAPVLLKETAIIKDTVDNEILLRNTMVNISEDDIVAIAVRIKLWDIFGEIVKVDDKNDFEYVYQDIFVGPGKYFGNKIAINLPDNARRAEVYIEKTVTNSGKVWNTNPDNIVDIQPPREIEGDEDFIAGVDDNAITPLYYYVENSNSWQCTCGQVNKAEDTKCRYCGREKTYVSQTFSEDGVKGKYEEYIRQVKEQQRKQQEEQEQQLANEYEQEQNISENTSPEETDSKTQKNRRNIFIICGIVLVVLVAVIIIIIVNSNSNPLNSESDQEKIDIITSLLGEEVTEDEPVHVAEDVYDFFQNAQLFGLKGTVEIRSNGSVVTIMKWISNDKYTDSIDEDITDKLNDIYGECYIESKDFDEIDGASMWYVSNQNYSEVACGEDENEKLNIYWIRNLMSSETVWDTRSELVSPLVHLGRKDFESNVSYIEERPNTFEDINIFGHSGTISLDSLEGWDIVSSVIWTSNNTMPEEDFKYLLLLLNEYFDKDYKEGSYDDISEDCFVWRDTEHDCDVIAYYKNKKVIVEWRLDNEDVYSKADEVAAQETSDEENSDDTNDSSSGSGSKGGVQIGGGRLRSGSSSGSSSSGNSSNSSGSTSSSSHTCAVSGCNKAGVYSIQGISGQTEYYCSEHYKEMQDTINGMMEDVNGN